VAAIRLRDRLFSPGIEINQTRSWLRRLRHSSEGEAGAIQVFLSVPRATFHKFHFYF
jgi:hypothetical protein